MEHLIGITGGIGAGKSVLSRILRLKGFPVYDCDSRARMLMEESEKIVSLLKSRYGEDCVCGSGGLNRELIASRVFSDEREREWLNTLVHAEVRQDIESWFDALGAGPAFVESAIMVTSGLDRICDRIVLVDAPEELRVERALERGGAREDIMRRIHAQRHEFDLLPEEKVVRVDNSGATSLLTAVGALLTDLEYKVIKKH